MGFFSIHFDPETPYVDHSKTPEDWKTDDGTHPQKLYFENWQYDNQTRNFKGAIIFGPDNKYYGAAEYRYDLTFGEDFTEIKDGYRYSVDETGTIIQTHKHYTGGTKLYEYIIQHDVQPINFTLGCKVVLNRVNEQPENFIAYYSMHRDTN